MWKQREDLEKEEVILSQGGFATLFGKTQGYVRHCDRRTGSKEKLKKELFMFPSATYNMALKDEMFSYFDSFSKCLQKIHAAQS